MPSSPVVYLDTQDYSRFGDVLRGRSDAATEALFLDLEKRKQAGDVIFAVSMPILGELLQYDASFRETTIRKAEAVERLCGSWALAFPSRLVAAEIAELAQRQGLLSEAADTAILSSDRYWFPNIADAFGNIRAQMRDALDTEISALPSRELRRRAKKEARRFDLLKAAREAAPQMAAEYGLPVEAITESIVALLRGRVNSEQASRRLFSAIAEPVKFVEAYFEKVETDRSLLPSWVSKFGADFEARFVDLRNKLQPHMKYEFARSAFDTMLTEWPEKLGRPVFKMAGSDVVEFGIDSTLFTALAANEKFAAGVPACEIVGKVTTAYVRQITGLIGTEAKIERSFGGDLVHALYLPHVDLWRGDRRFSVVVRNAVPRYADRIVPTLRGLSAAIDAWHPSDSGERG
jgi:hypothetical protein